MLNDTERDFLSKLNGTEIERDLREITRYERPSGSEGERLAHDYVASRLEENGMNPSRTTFPAWTFSFGEARMRFWSQGKEESLPVKIWGYSPDVWEKPVRGKAVFVPSESFPPDSIAWFADRSSRSARDLEGKIVLSTTRSAVAIRDAFERGAFAYVFCWPYGDEDVIHESAVCAGWGAALPEDVELYPKIPVFAVNHIGGNRLMELAASGDLDIELRGRSRSEVRELPLLEACLPGDSPYFILLGSHMDAKHHGATDNGTGCALMLALALRFSSLKRRPFGLRFCWWSGHEFSKYAGSSNYALERFGELDEHCLCYINADVPGAKGSEDFSQVAATPDFMALARGAVRDVTGQDGEHFGPVNSYDQSFYNIGVSSCFIWSSQTAPDSPHASGKGGMPWWWHTEEDTFGKHDMKVLMQDCQLYALGTYRILEPGWLPDDRALWDRLIGKLEKIDDRQVPGLHSILISLKSSRERLAGKSGLKERLFVIRRLNQALYCQRAPYFQDFRMGEAYVPGLSLPLEALATQSLTDRAKFVLDRYILAQRNRLLSLAQELERC